MTDLPTGRSQSPPIAIIGMAGIFPSAKNLQEYWQNIVEGRDCISDVPSSHWRVEDYYDPDPAVPDKTYCKRGGFIPEIDFHPLEFGLPPNSLEQTDTSQLLSLVVAKRALEDAGYGHGRFFDRSRTGVILGIAGAQKLVAPFISRLQYPVWEKVLSTSGPQPDVQQVTEKMRAAYIPWDENALPGGLSNVVAGRVANRLDLGGINCVVDAACAGSLAAVNMAVSELVAGNADMMISGGVETDNSIVAFVSFCKTPTLSKQGTIRPFDDSADGMLIGEGVGMLVLRRLEDAERDGDRVYAVIRGIGSSSDGLHTSIYAPRSEGQANALRRAYQNAGLRIADVGLIEAHGTGTIAGDLVEASTLVDLVGEDGPGRRSVALGSVKSQIGHTRAAAGAAGLIKTALALQHKVLPPTINVTRPHPQCGAESSPVYLNTETRPWLLGAGQTRRRAGVSSFGFGGTNFHTVLEEHENEQASAYRLHSVAQPVILSSPTVAGLRGLCQAAVQALSSDAAAQRYADLLEASTSAPIPTAWARLGFVSTSRTEACELLQLALNQLAEDEDRDAWEHPRGISYRLQGVDPAGKIVALFPGQGSQYVGMGREIANNFPTARAIFGAMDTVFTKAGRESVSRVVYPAPTFDAAGKTAHAQALQRTEYAQAAVGSFSAALYRILEAAGFRPDFVAGHSFGELTALWAAGAMSEADFLALTAARGRALSPPDDADFEAGAMLAIRASAGEIRDVLADVSEVRIANINSGQQVVVGGAQAAIAQARDTLQANGYQVIAVPVAAAFHTPLVSHADQPFREALGRVNFSPPHSTVYSTTTGEAYPSEPEQIRATLASQLLLPVQFQRQVENIAAAGGCIFVEVGPGNVLTGFVNEILRDRTHIAVALNPGRRNDSDRHLRLAVVQLRVAGLRLNSIDPFALATQPVESKTQQRGLRVRLNASNYVSEKTTMAFERALNNGSSGHAEDAPKPKTDLEYAPKPKTDLEYALAQLSEHESQSLRVHEQYLTNQLEYSRIFLELTQQQQGLLLGPRAADLPAGVVENLARSMTYFHEHQAATLRVHEEYLHGQREYGRALANLVQQHYGGSGSGSAPMSTQPRPSPSPPSPPRQATPAPAPAPRTALPASPPATPAQPVVSLEHYQPPVRPAAAPANGSAHLDVRSPRETTPAAIVPSQPSIASVSRALLEVVSDKTGYPIESLELDMEIGADLGIDSIKQLEIVAAMLERYPDAPRLEPADLAELRSLGDIVEYLKRTGDGAAARSSPEPAAVAAVATPARQQVGINGLAHRVIRRTALAQPGRVERCLAPGSVCLITDDGTATSAKLAQSLIDLGWTIVALTFPRSVVAAAVPGWPTVERVLLQDLSETQLEQALAEVSDRYGPVGAFVHVNPPGQPRLPTEGFFLQSEEAIVSTVFLLGKHLKRSITEAAQRGWACFVTVSRLDGKLGTGLDGEFGAIAGGLGGLTKTLKTECEGVFCRAIDLDPGFEPARAAACIVAELLDPDDQIVEVAYGSEGRTTLVAEKSPGSEME